MPKCISRYGPDIQCEPRSCGQPPEIVNGWHAGECYNFGCRISYQCGDGYELVGKPDRFCQATGDWSPSETPTCVRKYNIHYVAQYAFGMKSLGIFFFLESFLSLSLSI